MEFRSVEAIVRALNAAGVEYLIVGGLAVNAHGFVRLTRDVDLVLRLVPENADRGLRVLLAIGYRMSIPEEPAVSADAAVRERWRDEKGMIDLKLWSDEHPRTPVDLFIHEPFSFPQELARAWRLEISPGVRAPVVALETRLEMKRAVGHPQDLIDLEELERMR